LSHPPSVVIGIGNEAVLVTKRLAGGIAEGIRLFDDLLASGTGGGWGLWAGLVHRPQVIVQREYALLHVLSSRGCVRNEFSASRSPHVVDIHGVQGASLATEASDIQVPLRHIGEGDYFFDCHLNLTGSIGAVHHPVLIWQRTSFDVGKHWLPPFVVIIHPIV